MTIRRMKRNPNADSAGPATAATVAGSRSPSAATARYSSGGPNAAEASSQQGKAPVMAAAVTRLPRTWPLLPLSEGLSRSLPWLAVATKHLLDFPLIENNTDTPLDTGATSKEASMTDRSDLTDLEEAEATLPCVWIRRKKDKAHEQIRDRSYMGQTERLKPYGPKRPSRPALLETKHRSRSPPRRAGFPPNLAAMLRSSARLLRKLRDRSGRSRVEAAARRLSGAATDFSLLRPLPGLDLPPPLPDKLTRSPTLITTLPNGIRVASEDVPGPSACIGVFVDSGSIYETKETNGVTHLLEKLAFKDTAHRSHLQIVQELELAGGNVGATAAREQMVYSYDTLKAYMPEAVELLLDCVRNPLFPQDEVDHQLALAREEAQALQKNPERFLMEALNLVGYSGALANPLIAPEDALERINSSAIQKFYHENFTADRLILAASGVEHQDLLDFSEHLLNDWHKGSPVEKPKSTYIGGDFRHKAESDMTHVALAFEVPGGWLEERDATIMTVMQTLMGGGGSFSSGGPGKGMHSRLYLRVLNKYHSVHSFSAFSNVYDNSGLFGIYLTTTSDFVAKAVDVAISELIAIATPGEVTEVELKRAKNSTISSVLLNLESRVIVAEDIGRQLLTYGCRKPIDYFLQCMDEMTVDHITEFAQRILSSQPTMASWGDVEKVPPYDIVCKRLR